MNENLFNFQVGENGIGNGYVEEDWRLGGKSVRMIRWSLSLSQKSGFGWNQPIIRILCYPSHCLGLGIKLLQVWKNIYTLSYQHP